MRDNVCGLGGRVLAAVLGLALAGCGGGGGDSTQSFALRFAAMDGSAEVGCGDDIGGVGPGGASSIEISDLRFYVSNIRFSTANGEVAADLDENEFQYTDTAGSVALIDLTDTAAGACSGAGITFPEGTARMNDVVTGTVDGTEITGVSFEVGLPQALMKSTLANHTAEDAPSPLAEMHWSWAFAYRFFVMNAVINDGTSTGEGYLHIGSTDCGGDGTRAMTDRDTCGNVNTARVTLTSFDPAADTVAVDVRQLLSGLDFEVSTEEVTYAGLECHSSPGQPDCSTLFSNFGINIDTGNSNAGANRVFRVQ